MNFSKHDINRVRNHVIGSVDLSVKDAVKLLVLLDMVDRDHSRRAKRIYQQGWRTRNKMAIEKAKESLMRYYV